MNDALRHDQLRPLLEGEALDALAPEEHALLAAHLPACAECQRDLGSLRETVAALGALLPVAPIPAERSQCVRGRLVARARADAGRAAEAPVRSIDSARAPARAPRAPWLAAAALAALLLGTGAYALTERAAGADLRARLAAVAAERDWAREGLAERERLVGELVAPATRVIDLASVGEQAPGGRMFWVPATDRWTFFARNLPVVPEGRVYQLWLVTPEGPVSAGTFEPAPDGSAMLRAEYELAPGALRAVAVSEEPAGGVPSPTGPIVIAGEFGR